MDVKPIVVYHVAAMGNWKDVIGEQLGLCKSVGLDEITVTFVGEGLDWFIERACEIGVTVTIARSDLNTDHYETFAIMEIEKIAKETETPILYFHTKGVSNPDNHKTHWRYLMNEWVIRRWEENLEHLKTHDAVGVNWWEHGFQHFSGNFWMANPSWIRTLPYFPEYHAAMNRVRYSCETWIGANGNPTCKAYSLGCKNVPFWEYGINFSSFLPHDCSMEIDARHAGWLKDIIHSHPFNKLLEIGCYRGYSSKLFSGSKGQVHLCDIHLHENLFKVLSQNPQFVFHQKRSIELLSEINDFDFIFIDGNHCMNAVKEEVDSILPHMPLVVVAHDTNATACDIAPDCEGPTYLKWKFQTTPGYFCLEDSVKRQGERTHRGLFFATRSPYIYQKAQESLIKWGEI